MAQDTRVGLQAFLEQAFFGWSLLFRRLCGSKEATRPSMLTAKFPNVDLLSKEEADLKASDFEQLVEAFVDEVDQSSIAENVGGGAVPLRGRFSLLAFLSKIYALVAGAQENDILNQISLISSVLFSGILFLVTVVLVSQIVFLGWVFYVAVLAVAAVPVAVFRSLHVRPAEMSIPSESASGDTTPRTLLEADASLDGCRARNEVAAESGGTRRRVPAGSTPLARERATATTRTAGSADIFYQSEQTHGRVMPLSGLLTSDFMSNAWQETPETTALTNLSSVLALSREAPGKRVPDDGAESLIRRRGWPTGRTGEAPKGDDAQLPSGVQMARDFLARVSHQPFPVTFGDSRGSTMGVFDVVVLTIFSASIWASQDENSFITGLLYTLLLLLSVLLVNPLTTRESMRTALLARYHILRSMGTQRHAAFFSCARVYRRERLNSFVFSMMDFVLFSGVIFLGSERFDWNMEEESTLFFLIWIFSRSVYNFSGFGFFRGRAQAIIGRFLSSTGGEEHEARSVLGIGTSDELDVVGYYVTRLERHFTSRGSINAELFVKNHQRTALPGLYVVMESFESAMVKQLVTLAVTMGFFSLDKPASFRILLVVLFLHITLSYLLWKVYAAAMHRRIAYLVERAQAGFLRRWDARTAAQIGAAIDNGATLLGRRRGAAASLSPSALWATRDSFSVSYLSAVYSLGAGVLLFAARKWFDV